MPKKPAAPKSPFKLPFKIGSAKPSGAKGDTVRVKVGNYRAPVDTAGMDPEMKATMGLGRAKKRK